MHRRLLEQEIKLPFESVEAARRAVVTAGARLLVSRRLLCDTLYDTPDGRLHRERSALRVRRDGTRGVLTFKGPTQAGPVKTREEVETPVENAEAAECLVRSLGFQGWFRAEKYREEYELGAAHLTVDETPIGVFIEVEGSPEEIERAARQLGRTPADYRLESYPRLYFAWCARQGLTPGEMVFEDRTRPVP
jgi:adenylate cyclase class 2